MLNVILLHTVPTKWLSFTVVILICLFSQEGSAQLCNQTFISRIIKEYPDFINSTDVIDLKTHCPTLGSPMYTTTLDGGEDNTFTLNINTISCIYADAEARLSTNSSLYANPWTIVVKITDQDGNFTDVTVLISITSNNDNPATMTDLKIPDFPEDTPVGTHIGGCTLSDGDFPGSGHDIPYVEISAGNGENRFAVDKNTCDVLLVRPVSYAKTSSYTLTFRAYNFPNDTLVCIQDVTFNITQSSKYPPRCNQLTVFIGVPENVAINTALVNLSCTNFDGTPGVSYSPGEAGYLNVTEQSGSISLSRPLKYDSNTSNNVKYLPVKIVRTGTPGPETLVKVYAMVQDVDDNKPEFTPTQLPFSADITKRARNGHLVIKLNATDRDGPNTFASQITYGFTAPCTPDWLVIDKDTGSIYVNGTLNLSTASKITCQVYVYSSNLTDVNSTASLSVTIYDDINKPPVFLQGAYNGTVKENSNVTTYVLSVSATDPEGKPVTYSFPSGQNPPTWPFNINSVTGEITAVAPIDYEQKTSYFGQVLATDHDGPFQTTAAYVYISVTPANEFTPQFSALNPVYIDKWSTPGTFVQMVKASDGDAGDDGKIEFNLDDPNAPFVIVKETGALYVGIGLSSQTNPFYNVAVTARDKSKSNVLSNITSVTVNFNIDKKNNNDPACAPLGPIVVTPNYNVSDPIGYLSCSDADYKKDLSYHIETGDTYNKFTVVTYNGTIRIGSDPIAGSYIIVFSISDDDSPARTTKIAVQINVETNLKFINLPASISVMENSNASNIIFPVSAQGAFDPIKYEIVNGNGEMKFHLNQMTGALRLVTTLDRENVASYDLTITATTTSGQSTTQHLQINVTDQNDNIPIYPGSFSFIRVSETQAVTFPLKQYGATDRDIDENAHLDYSIVSGDPGNMFRYDSTGELYLISPLDYETNSLITLVLGVSDRGVPSLSSTMIVNVEVVNVDNENVVIVQSGGTVSVTLPEDTAIGAAVAKINVQNNGNRTDLTFTIISGNPGNNFTIDEKTGVVYLIYSLDRETDETMTIGIRVSSINGKQNETLLVVSITDVNDCFPDINPQNFVFFAQHGTKPGSSLGTVPATDADKGANADLTLSIISGDPNGRFIFIGNALIVASVLDANVQKIYNLIITAADHGKPSLNTTAYITVIVEPEYKSPYFIPTRYAITLEETRTPGSLIFDCDATFNGAAERSSTNLGDLVYSVSSGDRSKFFVDADTGELQLIGPLNYSTDTTYTLTIKASNRYNLSISDNFALTIKVSQVNRHCPVFYPDLIIWSVSEAAAVGTIVGRLSATDKDPGQYGRLSYSLEANNKFKVNPITGEVTLTSPLEYSTDKSFSLAATVTDDGGLNSKTAIIVCTIYVMDTNNHSPVFGSSSYQVTVPEDLLLRTVFTIVVAIDLDSEKNGSVLYTVVSGNSNGIFIIDSATGAMSLNSNLDYERARQHILVIRGQDGGIPSLSGTTTVTIDVADQNDNPPNFGRSRIDLTVTSDTLPRAYVYKMSASDADSGPNGLVRYVIQNGNTNPPFFSIDSDTGVIRTASSLTSADSFQTFIVAGIDHGEPPLTGTITVAITVRPVQSPPSGNYNFSVPENAIAGTLVGTIPNNSFPGIITGYTISGGNNDNAFEISINANANGLLKTRVKLDREMYAFYQLLISAVSNRGSTLTTISVKVLDQNDCAPVFAQSVLNAQVVENMPAGYTVGILTATDADEIGSNSMVDLRISPATPPASVYFAVEPSGAIVVKTPISFEVLSSLSFKVVASDRGTPQLQSAATVNVKVVDVNETKELKYFETASFTSCDFPDDAVEGDVVCLLKPADIGVTIAQGDTVTYTIVGTESVFIVHPSTGHLILKKRSFIYTDARYFQWVIVTVNSGQVATPHALMVRLDAFNKKRDLISVIFNTDINDLQNKQTAAQALLQARFPQANAVVNIWSLRSTTSSFRRRRLLASQSEALVIVERDKSVNNISNIGVAKTFIPSAEAVKQFQQSSNGNTDPQVSSILPYSNNDDSDSLDPAYIALIVIGSIAALALIIAIIVLIIYCVRYRRMKGTDKRKLVEKKKRSKETFGNIKKTKRSDVRSKPALRNVDPDDPNSDGLPVQPTTALFISTSKTDMNASESRPQKNYSTKLESLEEQKEENLDAKNA